MLEQTAHSLCVLPAELRLKLSYRVRGPPAASSSSSASSLLLCHLLLNHDAPSIGCRCGNRCGEVQKRPCKLPCVKTPKAFCASSRPYILECDGCFAVCWNLNRCACNSGDKLFSLHFILFLGCFCCRSQGCKHWLVILADWTWWSNNHPSWAVMHISLLCYFIYMLPCIVIFLFFLFHF